MRRRAACAGSALGRGVDPESLAILQQRMGQRIEFEGDGAETMQVGPRTGRQEHVIGCRVTQ